MNKLNNMPNKDHNEEKMRLKRLEDILNQGVNAYPSKYEKKHKVVEIKEANDGKKLKTAGRIITKREMGKIIFCHLQDFSGRAQIALRDDVISKEDFKFFAKKFDMGDFVGVVGEVFTTKKGEKTLLVKNYKLLSKSLLPLPEKWHGLKNKEERLRKRYLDILANPEVKDLFIKKSLFWQAVRQFLLNKKFIEVETPVLEITAGGADATPFKTHHNALDMELYLRISMGELWQKRLMVAGFEKTFEIGRQFRNEGMDAEHLQDYTQMEFYWAYADWQDGMQLTEELVKFVARETFGKLKFKIKDFNIDLAKQWKTYDYRETIEKYTDIDIEKTSLKDIKKRLKDLKVNYDEFNNLGRGVDQLIKFCRRKLPGPGFLVYPPKAVSPLAKESKDRPGYVERYQFILAGSELANGYSELNDPLDQEARFNEQSKLRQAGDSEAQMMDKDFVEALKHGMPLTTGMGFSERLFAFLMDKPLRDCQLFPLMRKR